jgi:hypothetical protein
MSFLPPPPNQALEEVQPENLIVDKDYLIETNSYDGENIKLKGKFIRREGDGEYVLSTFKVSSMGNMNVPFLNKRTRFYRPRTQEILDNQALRQYVASQTIGLINDNTGTSLGQDIVDNFNNPKPPSGGKIIKKLKTKHRKRKQTKHRKGKQSRRKK